MALADPENAIKCERMRLNEAISNDKYMMAYQLFKSLYYRYINIQNNDAAFRILHEAIIFLLDKGQTCYAISMSQMFAKSLLPQQIEPCDEIFDHVQEIFIKFGLPLASKRESMLNSIIEWSIEMCPQYPDGHPNLHKRIGFAYWREANFSSAQYHYLRSSDSVGFASMLVELHKNRGFKLEVDLFITQAVLRALCLQNKTIAKSTFLAYINLHPDIYFEPPYMYPLLNFLSFLFEILEKYRCSLKLYIVICEQYQSCLVRDPTFVQYLDKIGQLFFNIQPASQSQDDSIDF